ncbi:MAG TPA: ABC transporter permease [Terracidiphilus sp.]|jgi:predicted permease|nr:ABC transporter permease [Terracidiphilus sp.]
MSGTKRLRRRLWAFLAKRALDAELEAEIAADLQLAIDEFMERGMSRDEARRQALIRLGGVQQAREKHREARGLMHIDILLQDLKYTVRKLLRDPGFTAVAVLILSLGIGANVAVFSVVNTIMLRPLPFPHAEELVWIAPPPTKCGLSCATYSTDAYDEFRRGTHSFQDVTGYFAFSTPGNLRLSMGNGAPIPATSIDVIANFFEVLGVQPAMGRLFRPEDGRNGAASVVVLTDAWWRRQFAADPDIVGKAFDISGQQTTVIGVLPKSFDFGAVFSPGAKIDALTPLNLYGPPRDWGNIITFIGRMKPGVSLAQATQDAAAVVPTMCWNNKRPDTCGVYKGAVVPVPLKEYVSGRLRQSLAVLWSAVGMILLIACVNLSNLLLARAAARSKEFAMRGALGAGRSRIVRQLLTESLVLSGAGAVFGLLLASILVSWLTHQGSIALPLLSQLHIDGAALGWTLLIAVSSAVLFGLAPGLRMAAGNLHEALKDSGAGSGQSRKHERLRSVLVVSEVALACVLLVGAGLLLRSFLRVLDVDLGFQPERAAAVSVDYTDNPGLGNGNTPDSFRAILAARAAYFQPLIERVSALPGVEAAGITDYLPLAGNRSWGLPFPKGVERPKNLHVSGPLVYVVSPGYLRAIGTRVRGRDFNWSDWGDTQNVVVIDEAYAKFLASYAHWPNNDAVGQVLDNGSSTGVLVVGVAEDVHAESVEGENGWQIYYPGTQTFWATPQLVVRTTLPPAQLAGSVMRVLREANPKQTAAEFKLIQSLVDHANSSRQFFMLLVGAFAVLGLLLAALGIYGVISYSVTRQTQEIGIRMALGASASHVQGRVLKGTLRLALMGIAVGAGVSMGTAKLVASLLYATSPWDVATYCGMAAALLVVAAVAGYVPARRASRISPLLALRAE